LGSLFEVRWKLINFLAHYGLISTLLTLTNFPAGSTIIGNTSIHFSPYTFTSGTNPGVKNGLSASSIEFLLGVTRIYNTDKKYSPAIRYYTPMKCMPRSTLSTGRTVISKASWLKVTNRGLLIRVVLVTLPQ